MEVKEAESAPPETGIDRGLVFSNKPWDNLGVLTGEGLGVDRVLDVANICRAYVEVNYTTLRAIEGVANVLLAYIRLFHRSPSNPVVLDCKVNFDGSASRFSIAAEETTVAKAAARTLVMVNFILNI